MKITILGDIMCEPPILKAAKQKDGSYDFRPMFQQIKPMLAESDYVVSNLETPLAGETAKYTLEHYVFNAPDAYADAIKDAGIDLLSTANNHTFDRGMEGLIRTLQVLDQAGIPHTGTWAPGMPREEAYYAKVGALTVAFIAYTYGTNYKPGGVLAEGEYKGTVNLLRPKTETVYLPGVLKGPDWVDKLFPKLYREPRGKIKKLVGLPYNHSRADDNLNKETMAPYMEQFQADIRKAKEKADLVICYPHVGGQFNPKPGTISEYVVAKAVEAGADAVLASHSHIVQKMEYKGTVPCAFSLGNFSMDPNSSLMLHKYAPDCGLAVHLYVEDKKIVKTTFSILKGVQKGNAQLVSWPVDLLYPTLKTKKEQQKLEWQIRYIYKTVTGKALTGDLLQAEYFL